MRLALTALALLLAAPLRAEDPEALARARREALEVEAAGLLREAEAAAGLGDHAAALSRLREAEAALRGLPAGSQQRKGLEDRAAALRAAWEGSAREREASEDRERRRRAEQEVLDEMGAERLRLREARGRILARFEDAAARADDRAAERALADLRALDPSAPGLDALAARLAEARHARARVGTRAALAEEWRNLRESAREQAIPYSASILRYPERWNRITRSRQAALTAAAAREEAWRSALGERLARRLPLRFERTPFPEAVSTLESQGGIVIALDPSAREKVPDLDALEVTFRSQGDGMTLAHALDWLVRGTGLVWTLADEAVRIATPERSAEASVLERHDVRDVLAVPIDAVAPSVNMGVNKGLEFTDAQNEEASFTSEDLVSFLKEQVQPAAWNEPQNSVTYRNGSLFVNAPPPVQRLIREVLSGFRTQRTLQVLIQTRFITVADAGFESLGVDWKGLSPGGALPGVRTLPAGSSAGFMNPRGLRTDIRGAVVNQGQSITGLFPRTFNGGMNTAGGLGLQVAFLDTFQAEAVVEMVEKSGKANMLTAPALLCFNTQRANLVTVTQQAYIQDITAVVQVQAVGYDPEIGYLQTGIVFDVRPVVSADRKYITLELRPTVGELKQIRTVFTSGAVTTGGPAQQNIFIEAPTIDLTATRTTVSVPDGGTLLIAGLTKYDETRNYAAVPFLSKIPFLQALFSNKAEAHNRRSLVVLVKAQVVDQREIEEEQFGKE